MDAARIDSLHKELRNELSPSVFYALGKPSVALVALDMDHL
jgi:hypothetical protein